MKTQNVKKHPTQRLRTIFSITFFCFLLISTLGCRELQSGFEPSPSLTAAPAPTCENQSRPIGTSDTAVRTYQMTGLVGQTLPFFVVEFPAACDKEDTAENLKYILDSCESVYGCNVYQYIEGQENPELPANPAFLSANMPELEEFLPPPTAGIHRFLFNPRGVRKSLCGNLDFKLQYHIEDSSGHKSKPLTLNFQTVVDRSRVSNNYTLVPRHLFAAVENRSSFTFPLLKEIYSVDLCDANTAIITQSPKLGRVEFNTATENFTYTHTSTSAERFDLIKFKIFDGKYESIERKIEIRIIDNTAKTFIANEFSGKTLVVYNGNDPEAFDIAEYYRQARQLPSNSLCRVELPLGHNASRENILGAKKTIATQCLCNQILLPTRPASCESSAQTIDYESIRDAAPTTHLVYIRGIPMFTSHFASLSTNYGGWPGPTASLDFYLSLLLNTNYDWDPLWDGYPQIPFTPLAMIPNPAFDYPLYTDLYSGKRDLYLFDINPRIDKMFAYGRIEAITKDRTIELIDRTLAAEKSGFKGNFVSTEINAHAFFQSKTNGFDPDCTDYVSDHLTPRTIPANPVVPSYNSVYWPFDKCRAGTTTINKIAGAATPSGMMPGSPSSIPYAINVGMMGSGEYEVNNQAAFNDFSNMTRWRKTADACVALCAEFQNPSDVQACRANSKDYFKELNTDCVGVSSTFLGTQYRSHPVLYYGFFPKDFTLPSTDSPQNPPVKISAQGLDTAFLNERYTDNQYIHFGKHSWDNPDVDDPNTAQDERTQCTRADGTKEACLEDITFFYYRSLNYLNTPIVVPPEGRQFAFQIRHRNQTNAAGAHLYISLRFTNSSGVVYSAPGQNINMEDGHYTWKESDPAVFTVLPAQLNNITRVEILFLANQYTKIKSFLDLDGIEVQDLNSGLQLLSTELSSFTSNDQYQTTTGDYAANVIDRLGGIAWFGSASHHWSGGGAYGRIEKIGPHIFAGKTLGEAVVSTGSGWSAHLVGDPLLRMSAASIEFPNSRDIKSKPTHVSGVNNISYTGMSLSATTRAQNAYFLLSVLHGMDQLQTVQWKIETCGLANPYECDQQNAWTIKSPSQQTGRGAVREKKVYWQNWLNNPRIPQRVIFRLKVWNPGDEGNALYDFAFLNIE